MSKASLLMCTELARQKSAWTYWDRFQKASGQILILFHGQKQRLCKRLVVKLQQNGKCSWKQWPEASKNRPPFLLFYMVTSSWLFQHLAKFDVTVLNLPQKPTNDLHRYMPGECSLVYLGHSLMDLGSNQGVDKSCTFSAISHGSKARARIYF